MRRFQVRLSCNGLGTSTFAGDVLRAHGARLQELLVTCLAFRTGSVGQFDGCGVEGLGGKEPTYIRKKPEKSARNF